MMSDHNFCPRCGNPLQSKNLHGRVRPVCGACGYVVYLDPKMGAGVVVELNGKVVLVRRAVDPMRGHWSLPSGYVERDETPDATAVREMAEETGLQVEIDGLLNVYSFAHEVTGGRGVLVLYAAHVTGGDLVAGDDAGEVRAFGPDELPPDVAFDSHRQALKDWRRAKAIVYRQARDEELAQVRELNEGSRQEIGRTYPAASGDGVVFVAADGEQVVGYALLTAGEASNTACLDQIFVRPSHRRWGVARHLMSAVVNEARRSSRRAVLARVPADSPALVFYLKAGFRISGYAEEYDDAFGSAPGPVLYLTIPLQTVA